MSSAIQQFERKIFIIIASRTMLWTFLFITILFLPKFPPNNYFTNGANCCYRTDKIDSCPIVKWACHRFSCARLWLSPGSLASSFLLFLFPFRISLLVAIEIRIEHS
ncbi:hypothetical protein GQ55_1G164300 [Panicum hallii var. hallii]|uniref:Uncharacterized protein n=1 Tax=Panicum hallii var. hallii TaxID=1504633 RepID=A0A2T7F5R6_9POAL|nr:hypothetical protein GQ55_1G164300 [Panicum hallii var. hallii]PUZ75402.1 hypothetical protein GQ55_1G164300 [Panicum hallii var. hallii]